MAEKIACMRTEVQDLVPAAIEQAGERGTKQGQQEPFLEEDQMLKILC